MKTVTKYLLSLLLPGISLMTNRKFGIGLFCLIIQVGAFTWTIITKLVMAFSAQMAMSLLAKTNISFLLTLNNVAPVIWLLLAAVATYFVWKGEKARKDAEASISSLS